VPTAASTTAGAHATDGGVRPHRFDEHGNVRIDQYYWLRDRDNPKSSKYLEDENALHQGRHGAHTGVTDRRSRS